MKKIIAKISAVSMLLSFLAVECGNGNGLIYRRYEDTNTAVEEAGLN
ncbi:hypothetical protein [Ruminococcus sp.]|nr:hypothetical protein [Ruminococcus sp.]